jgi:LysM repeat protein
VLGAEADRRHWFPELDEDGNFVSAKSEPQQASTADDSNPESPAPPKPSTAGYEYVIKAGESLAIIAETLHVSIEEIFDANPGLDATKLLIGQKISIPAPQPAPPNESGYQYEVVSGDTLIGIARRYAEAGMSVTFQNILHSNPGLVPTKIMAGQKIFIPRQ